MALEQPQSVVRGVLEETGRQLTAAEEADYRAEFEPHAVILTERLIPSPIFVVAFIGVSRLLRIDFDLAGSPDTFVAQALDGLTNKLLEFDTTLKKARLAPEVVRHRATLPAFGAPTGFVINYAPDHAVRYDIDGNVMEILGRAKRLGSTSFSLSGRPLSDGELNSIFGKAEIVRQGPSRAGQK